MLKYAFKGNSKKNLKNNNFLKKKETVTKIYQLWNPHLVFRTRNCFRFWRMFPVFRPTSKYKFGRSKPVQVIWGSFRFKHRTMSSRTEELAVAVSATIGTCMKQLIFKKGESSLISNNSTTLLQKTGRQEKQYWKCNFNLEPLPKLCSWLQRHLGIH